MAGCDYYENPSYDYSDSYKVIYMDSCEYIKYKYNPDFTHKGNCKFCKQRRKAELKEIVELLKNKWLWQIMNTQL